MSPLKLCRFRRQAHNSADREKNPARLDDKGEAMTRLATASAHPG
jgi:hypothetical protein